MELKYENIKSIILGILIVTSLLLTWNLWTYEPRYEELQDTKTIQEVTLGPEKKVKDIIRANQVMFHLDQVYYGTMDDHEIGKIMDEVASWTMGNFQKVDIKSKDDMLSITNQDNMVEILYPDKISMSIFREIIPINHKNVPEDYFFDQIVIDMNVHDKGKIYFVSQREQKIYQTEVPGHFISEFAQEYTGYAKTTYMKYISYHQGTQETEKPKRPFYVPAERVELHSYQSIKEKIDSDDFKNALFHDPGLVQISLIAAGKEFTDGQSIMREHTDQGMIYYRNLAVADNVRADHDDLLERSINFINAHGGFTGLYRFAEMDLNQREVIFRLYHSNGYPIFGQDEPNSEIRLILGENDVNEYDHSNFYLGVWGQGRKVELLSGPEVVNALVKKDYDFSRIENMTIGYELVMKEEPLISLEPQWYFLYDGEWRKFKLEDTGGDMYGLE